MPALQYRALVEGLSSRMWSQYTGFLIWKTQNPWYGLRGQMYDWLLHPNAALFAIRCAAEPVHVQLCPRQGGVIQVLNSLGQTLAAKILVRAVALDGKQLYSQIIAAQVQPLEEELERLKAENAALRDHAISLQVCMHSCMHACMCVCMCVCVM